MKIGLIRRGPPIEEISDLKVEDPRKCEYPIRYLETTIECGEQVYANDHLLRALCHKHFTMVVEGREPQEGQTTL